MKNIKNIGISFGAMVIILLAMTTSVSATTDCTFTTVGTTTTIDADCTTDATILVANGYTLDGADHTITAVDPPGNHFKGAVVKNGGATANVKNLKVTTNGLSNICDAGDDRLRGIMFDGASGSITNNDVENINQGASGCQEGNAIEIRNAPFDGTHPNTKTVDIGNNKISAYQKTGIVANGDVFVDMHNNQVGSSATQTNLAANSVQLGSGALGTVKHNNIDGNSWQTYWVATAVLLYFAGDGVEVSQNILGGNADVGIYVYANNAIVDNNKVFESGPDGSYDAGIGNYGNGNSVTNNKVRGYDIPYEGDVDGNNKVIPGPNSYN